MNFYNLSHGVNIFYSCLIESNPDPDQLALTTLSNQDLHRFPL